MTDANAETRSVEVIYEDDEGEFIKCKECGNTWKYTGKKPYATCTNCFKSLNLNGVAERWSKDQ